MRSEVRESQRKRKLTISRCFLLIDCIQTLRTERGRARCREGSHFQDPHSPGWLLQMSTGC